MEHMGTSAYIKISRQLDLKLPGGLETGASLWRRHLGWRGSRKKGVKRPKWTVQTRPKWQNGGPAIKSHFNLFKTHDVVVVVLISCFNLGTTLGCDFFSGWKPEIARWDVPQWLWTQEGPKSRPISLPRRRRFLVPLWGSIFRPISWGKWGEKNTEFGDHEGIWDADQFWRLSHHQNSEYRTFPQWLSWRQQLTMEKGASTINKLVTCSSLTQRVFERFWSGFWFMSRGKWAQLTIFASRWKLTWRQIWFWWDNRPCCSISTPHRGT